MRHSGCSYAELMRSTEQHYRLKDGDQSLGWAAFSILRGGGQGCEYSHVICPGLLPQTENRNSFDVACVKF